MEVQTTKWSATARNNTPPIRLCRQGGALSSDVIVEMTSRRSPGGGGCRRPPSNGRMGSPMYIAKWGASLPLLGLLEVKHELTSILQKHQRSVFPEIVRSTSVFAT